MENDVTTDFGINKDGVLCFRCQICILNDEDLRQSILREAHSSPYAIRPGGNKMYQDLRDLYWWPGLNHEVTNFVARCLTCQQTEDKVQLIRDGLKATSDRKKSYTDLKRGEIEYVVGDFIFLKVSLRKKLELPPELDQIHDVFHIFMLRRNRSDPTYIVRVEEIEVRLDLTFEEEPVEILDRDIKVLRRESIPLVKVLW
ncbi:uncharacterized protein LOC108481139 [Gossypium arboreum]|uniref:uncharacterized protein LOC108481139 n=1 Tax=Gossypium arboreum TaxID=29729 RepID=UPI00081947A3|nr:uncharacterized protein LOC108481139 [Gossypium arboreum]